MVEKEIERIKRYTEQLYGVKLPKFDIQYSHEAIVGWIYRPVKLEEERLHQELLNRYNAGERSAIMDFPDRSSYLEFRTKKELRKGIKRELKSYLASKEEKLGIKINPKKYTIVLPTYERSDVIYALLEDELEKEKKEGPELEKARARKNYARFSFAHPELYIYAFKWHEIGHLLANSKNLSGDLNEGVAMLYGFKGLLLGAQEGKFKIDEIKEAMKIDREMWKTHDESHKRAFELVLGDFNLEFESLEEALQDIEKRINRYLEKRNEYDLVI